MMTAGETRVAAEEVWGTIGALGALRSLLILNGVENPIVGGYHGNTDGDSRHASRDGDQLDIVNPHMPHTFGIVDAQGG